MEVRREDGTTRIHLSEVSSITLASTQVYLSAYLLSELAKAKIPLVISDEKHNPVGQYLPLYGAHNTSKRIQEQLAWGEPAKKRVWQMLVREKIQQQARVLEDQELVDAARKLYLLVPEVRSGDTTNREAVAARIYFEALFGDDFSRSQETPLNAALNYGYAVLLSMVNREVASRGYLTQNGVCHRSEYNQFNFSCDLMEPFRPLIDRVVLESFLVDFDKDVRRALVDFPNRSVCYRGGVYRCGSVVSLYIQDCLNVLNKKTVPNEVEEFDWV